MAVRSGPARSAAYTGLRMSSGNPKRPRLRHPLEVPVYILMVVLNFVIAIVLIGLVLIELSPTLLHTLYIAANPLRLAAIAVLVAMLLAGLVLVLVRQLNRASVRGSSVLATDHQFPDIEAIKRDAAAALGFRNGREPEIYVAAGNGVLNAFAASAFGHDFVVVNSDLFANTLEQNQRALRFIVGHELGHSSSVTRGSGTSSRLLIRASCRCLLLTYLGFASCHVTGTERGSKARAKTG